MKEVWLNKEEIAARLRTVGVSPYRTVETWASQGLLKTRFAHVTSKGLVQEDVECDAGFWEKAGDFYRSLTDSITVRGNDGIKTVMSGLEVEESSLLAAMPKRRLSSPSDPIAMGADQGAIALLKAMRPAQDQQDPDTPKVETRGRKTDGDRLTMFYLAAVQLASEGRLTPEHFPSQASLSDELLLMMGDSAYSADHVKGRVAQLYRRFVADN